jgi:hypothetical protein
MIIDFKIFESYNSDLKYWMNFFWKELRRMKLPVKERNDSHYSDYSKLSFYFTRGTDEIDNSLLEEKLSELRERLLGEKIYISYEDFGKRSGGYYYNVYFKNLYTEMVIPMRYIYHCSPVFNRESIKKYGLIPRGSDESAEWGSYKYLGYPPAVFATNSVGDEKTVWKIGYGVDIWQIDTNGLTNEWWYDLNFFGTYKKDTAYNDV